jgi:hypothetical protein
VELPGSWLNSPAVRWPAFGLQPAGEAWNYGQWLRFFRLGRTQYLAS